MNTTTQTKTHEFYAARVMTIGMILGLGAMAALFIAGLVRGNVGMVVMASTMAALLAGTWSAMVASRKKKNAAAAKG